MTTDISVGVRWDPIKQEEVIEDFDYDGGNSSSRLFERSRIKALAGEWQLGLRPEGGGALSSGDLCGFNKIALARLSVIVFFVFTYC